MIERRKHRRIVTLKNFGRFMLVALLALAAMNVISEHRAPREHENALAVQQIPVVSTPAPEVIHEAPVIPSGSGDLRGGAAPLLAEASLPSTPPGNPATQQPGNPPEPGNQATRQPGNSIAITGDESGLSVVHAHKLRGGFNRQ